ncbi:DUF2848 family protein [Amycolatopsis bartoniae]|uniref:DUF2848 domain-containing protein n=1 Tax=Amycolatopsis bartoniae TaxID=941986 RepID=A0A8H9INX9_9PSEU|nr:DUF2848 family protein [Amycolatopsis bartoniae]TVT10019.1 DUF2848 domain-containing protein [Amycolatopsis bartoniae]GHF31720.1 hypothetical protein GCM10017566_00160 [Amycolatopsis bartoniae]
MDPLVLTASGVELVVRPERLIVAGYTAKDEESVAKHIAELAAIGVPPPPSVPAFYDLDPALLSTGSAIEVPGTSTSGEVEPVVVRHDGRYYLAAGSDHTDREIERTDITKSKAACPKPLSTSVAEIGTDLAALDWDAITAECTVDGTPYQRGDIGVLRHPADTVARMTSALGDIDGDLVLFCGTLPLLTGEFVFGERWRLELALPGGTRLTHTYETRRTR